MYISRSVCGISCHFHITFLIILYHGHFIFGDFVENGVGPSLSSQPMGRIFKCSAHGHWPLVTTVNMPLLPSLQKYLKGSNQLKKLIFKLSALQAHEF